ncbi:MAG: bacillithiol biosynthesis deacetylase BshB1 [Pirellulaceae bacterium]
MNEVEMLVVAPHPDDAELGMGGTIAKLIRQGVSVGILDLTTGEPTPHGSLEIRTRETGAASDALGIKWRHNLGLPNRKLEADLSSRAQLAEVFRMTKAKWIFAPFWEDAHPDHLAANELVTAARFWSKLSKTTLSGERHHPNRIFNYYCVHLKMHPQPAFVVDISDTWEQKRAAIVAYQSQFVVGREGERFSFIEQMEIEARYWGKSIGVDYGEPFHSPEPIGLKDLGALI